LPTGENRGQQVECLDLVAIDASPGQDSVSGQHAVHGDGNAGQIRHAENLIVDCCKMLLLL
jgi:hypothetical protein